MPLQRDYFQNGIRTTGEEKKIKQNNTLSWQNKDKVKDEFSEIFLKGPTQWE